MVTHNEMFLHALAERLIVFQDDGISVFEGSYERFLEQVGWQGEEVRPRAREDEGAGGPSLPVPLPPSRKELRKMRSEVITEKSKTLKPLEKRMAELEAAIETAEAELARWNRELVEAARAKASAKIVELSKAVHQRRKDVDAYLDELEPLLKAYETLKAEFDRRLEDLAAKELLS
jgi:ATP-binding cassette subfamily F protein 3